MGGRVELQTANFSGVLGPADLEFGSGYGVGGGFQVGTMYKLTNTVTLGAACDPLAQASILGVEFGDHPECAVSRMAWARETVKASYPRIDHLEL